MRVSVIAAVALLAGGCGSGSTSNGGSCDQACQDLNTATNLVQAVSFLYNQNLAGKPTGNQDLSVSCPDAGTVHITGSTAYDSSHGLTTTHLAYAMTGCRSVGTNYDLTLDGTLNQDGTFGSSETALSYQGPGLKMQGFAGGGAAKLSETCKVTITDQTHSISGTVCGRAFSGTF